MSETETSATFDGLGDRLTYVLANAQLVIAGAIVALGIVIAVVQPTLPSIPPWVFDGLAALFIFGPPLFLAGLRFARWLRSLRWVEVVLINVPDDHLEKFLVPPDIWSEREVEGPNPWRMGGKWVVREFDYDSELEQLRVKGTWLSEVQDTKLVTKKSHFEAIYDYLVERHLTLSVLRDSQSRFGAEVQDRLVTAMAEARERGQMMDKTAVMDTFDEFEEEANSIGEEDIPTFEAALDEEPDEGPVDMAEEANPASDGGEASGPDVAGGPDA